MKKLALDILLTCVIFYNNFKLSVSFVHLLFVFSVIFFFHFNYFKLGPVGGSRGNSESDQWGTSPSRSHQPVLKVRALSPTGCVCVDPHPTPENSCTKRWLSSVSLPRKHRLFSPSWGWTFHRCFKGLVESNVGWCSSLK